MFGIEKFISKPLLKLVCKGAELDMNFVWRIRMLLGSYLLLHLISVGLMSWMLYRLFAQKKKDIWSLVIPISGLGIAVFIPNCTSDALLDLDFNKFNNLITFFAFLGLAMGVIGIILYFFDIQFTKKAEGEEEESSKNQD